MSEDPADEADVDEPVDDRPERATDEPDRWPGDDAPGQDLLADIGAPTEAGAGDPFERIEVGSVDEDAVWADLAGGDPDGTADGDAAESTTGQEPPVTGSAVDLDGDEAVVPKGTYCEQCEHFSAPPEAACTNPGTEIRELVDVEHFRVVNCPVVERRQRIGESTED